MYAALESLIDSSSCHGPCVDVAVGLGLGRSENPNEWMDTSLEGNMPSIVLIVTVKVKPEHAERLKVAMLENAAESVQEEQCYQFDVIVSQEDENTFMFYEVYRDEQALADHRQTPHFLKYRNLLQELGENVERTVQLFSKLT